jgi:hypothetical protein
MSARQPASARLGLTGDCAEKGVTLIFLRAQKNQGDPFFCAFSARMSLDEPHVTLPPPLDKVGGEISFAKVR